MQPSSKKAVIDFLRTTRANSILDAPSGNGWLSDAFGGDVAVDGIDFFAKPPPRGRRFWKHDLDAGLPPDCGGYDIICCCEGLAYLGNPLLLFHQFFRGLLPGGSLIVSTPNVWYPQARLQYLIRGFFPSFPPLAEKMNPSSPAHIIPWSFPQLSIFYRLAGFKDPIVIRESLSRPKHFFERLVALPAQLYCRSKLRKSRTSSERRFWKSAASSEALLGRHLIVVGEKSKDA